MESMALIPFFCHQDPPSNGSVFLPHVLVARCGTTGPRQLVERSAKALVVVTTKQKLDRVLSDPRQMVHGHHEGSVMNN